jgi:hypothetical protein
LLRHDRYEAIRRDNNFTEEQMLANQVLRINPSFRIIAVGTPPERENPWLVAEVLSIFSFVDTLSVASLQDKMSIVSHISPPASPMETDLLSLLKHVCHNLESLAGGDMTASANSIAPSCRQLLRLWRSSKSNMNRALTQYSIATHSEWKDKIITDVNDKLLRMFMVPFMPTSLRDSFQSSLTSHATVMSGDATLFSPSNVEASMRTIQEDSSLARAGVESSVGGATVQIGGNVLPIVPPQHPELVPDTRFVSIKKHLSYLENIGNDVLANERHILLIGNQGKTRYMMFILLIIN